MVQTENEKRVIENNYLITDRRIEVVSNGVDMDIFKPLPVKKKTDLFTILYSGQLNDVNGVDALLEWFTAEDGIHAIYNGLHRSP